VESNARDAGEEEQLVKIHEVQEVTPEEDVKE